MTTRAARGTGKIGPNAIIQTVAALRDRLGDEAARATLVRGGAGDLPDHLPHELIDEREFHALVELLLEQIGEEQTNQVMARSGQLTSEYVFANRIPAFARLLLRLLPPSWGLRLLLPAMQRHTWTFAGSGVFAYDLTPTPSISITNGALFDTPAMAAAMCAYYRGAFEQMFQKLICSRATLHDLECQARGDRCCRYAIRCR
ncbi:bacteriochlorophyll 4-vinyl reductase [Roseiflexus castenholzii]|uniref:bacteriochlorophyll 4-vinyl reductase n=1 Tax=Roseiflexus castenholzii TaxID=120962 RepID=UPI003C7C20F8